MVWVPPVSSSVPVAAVVQVVPLPETSTRYCPIRPFGPVLSGRAVTARAVVLREARVSSTIQCGSGTSPLLQPVCQMLVALPSRTLAAAPFSPVTSWLSAVAIQLDRGGSADVGLADGEGGGAGVGLTVGAAV